MLIEGIPDKIFRRHQLYKQVKEKIIFSKTILIIR